MINALHKDKKLFTFLLGKSLESLMAMLRYRLVKLIAQTMPCRCHRYILTPAIFHMITLNNMFLL